MKGRLDLKNIILRLKLGVESHEKLSSRDVPITVGWTGEVSGSLSIDYSDVCDVLAGFMGSEYDYIEELAMDILNLLRKEFPDGFWKVTVTKPFPLISLKLESASFTVEGGGNG
jgi:dihydroneopterin aldolase